MGWREDHGGRERQPRSERRGAREVSRRATHLERRRPHRDGNGNADYRGSRGQQEPQHGGAAARPDRAVWRGKYARTDYAPANARGYSFRAIVRRLDREDGYQQLDAASLCNDHERGLQALSSGRISLGPQTFPEMETN